MLNKSQYSNKANPLPRLHRDFYPFTLNMWGRARSTGKIPHLKRLSPGVCLKSGAQARFQFHKLLFIHWATVMDHACILRFWKMKWYIVMEEVVAIPPHLTFARRFKSMHAVRHCYCMMLSGMLNHKTHAGQLRLSSLSVFYSHVGNFNAATLHTDYSQWPQWLHNSSTLASIWTLYY